MILPMDGDERSGWKPGTPTTFVNGPEEKYDAMFSPKGDWLAYVSLESGQPQVFVRPFPGPGSKTLIGAGVNPTWSGVKHQIFYGLDGQIMVADYAVEGGSFRARASRPWSDKRYERRGQFRMFDLHPDGERFALAPAVESRSDENLVLDFNFFDRLRRIAPTQP
jgi:serine/threonine-protein kinase